MFYKNISGDYITSVSTMYGDAPIVEEEYNAILTAAQEAPEAPSGYVYMLKDISLEWELVEMPPVPEPALSDFEVLEILLGGEL